jgi:hypothetical protein
VIRKSVEYAGHRSPLAFDPTISPVFASSKRVAEVAISLG